MDEAPAERQEGGLKRELDHRVERTTCPIREGLDPAPPGGGAKVDVLALESEVPAAVVRARAARSQRDANLGVGRGRRAERSHLVEVARVLADSALESKADRRDSQGGVMS